jgi:hypothetical protein
MILLKDWSPASLIQNPIITSNTGKKKKNTKYVLEEAPLNINFLWK